MNYFILLTISVVGLSGIIAQVLILRELLVSFYGNELTLGIILANWLLAEALGVFIIGKLIDRVKNEISFFIGLEVLFASILPVSIFLSRTFKSLLGIPFAEAIGLPQIILASFIIILPVGFCHGALFSASVKLYSLFFKRPEQSIGRVYAWEIIGTIAGTLILTYLFIPYLNSFRIAFIVSSVNLIVAAAIIKYQPGIKRFNLVLIGLITVLILGISPDYLQQISIAQQWQGQKVLDYRNSIYGNIVVTNKQEQNTFFYNGMPIITAPYPDITFVEEFGNLPLLFHHNPRDILIIGAGAGGLINEIEKHAVREIDYAELDPQLISTLNKYSAGLINKELGDRRVNIINSDGRLFLKSTTGAYDVILVGLSKPSDLSVNRIFSQEFFYLAKRKLRDGGIMAIWLPGSLTYVSRELGDLNACIINALKVTFGYVRVIPGDYNIILASNSSSVFEVTPMELFQRIRDRGIKTNILTSAYLGYRLDRKWLDWFNRSSLKATKELNSDLRPIAVFEMLIYWNKHFSLKFAYFLETLRSLNLVVIFILIIILTLIMLFVSQRWQRLKLTYAIATTGFFGMLMSLVLIFAFQVSYGYIYHIIGLLIGIFMAGSALGSILMTKRLSYIINGIGTLIKLEIFIALFSGFVALVLTRLTLIPAQLVFPVLFFIAGLLLGFEFPLVSNLSLSKKSGIGQTAGIFYAADLIGGWFAGILGGIVLLPVLGLFQTCLIIIFLKLSSILLLALNRR